MHYSNTTELSLSQGKYKHKQNVNCLYSTELWSVQGGEWALSQGGHTRFLGGHYMVHMFQSDFCEF